MAANIHTRTTSDGDMTAQLLERFGLTDAQKAAACERARDVAVTAGAGSGKTRTLVARYLPLLAECGSSRRIVAITFTEKAAREMRNRIRDEVRKLVTEAADDFSRQRWIDLESRLDSARISTIHSLCQEVLRAHPVEAELDPKFAVVDENQAALLRAEAVRSALTSVVENEDFQTLFHLWKAGTLESVLNLMVNQRLEIDEVLKTGCDPNQAVQARLEHWMRSQLVESSLSELRSAKADGSLSRAANNADKLAAMALDLITDLEQAQAGLDADNFSDAALALFTARRQHMKRNIGKASSLKVLVRDMGDAYDKELSWIGGAAATDPTPSPQYEQQVDQTYPLLFALYRNARDAYLSALRRSSAVDFNDLEGKTYELLEHPEIAMRWQAEIDWVLVDEFQDTNARQREIIRALCGGANNKLFVVGDARQSIYRFRGADVTVFRNLQVDIDRAGGLLIDLDRTFRTHDGLLVALGDLLKPIMNAEELVSRPFHVPYSSLTAHRTGPRENVIAPHIEFVLSPGRDSATGRKAAARSLAQRLLALKADGQIHSWDEATLLFRASTSFQYYEDAFEAYAIPYVTIAGQGFYDRPEIRDVLNLLRALADPWDDLALAGLLCSPAFGMRQIGLAKLRFQGDQKTSLFQALQGDISILEDADWEVAERAKAFLQELLPWVDRIPVAELLQRVVAWTNYRAILAAGSHRLWRNLDKLLADSQASGAVQVQAFLEYLGTLKDVGAREGEAAAEAEGAVRLMTIHKSKGLEFEFVILADASRAAVNQASTFYLLPEIGLALKPDRIDSEPLAYRLSKTIDKQQAESEDCRLLYVALTRAKEKVIISGHYTVKEAKLSVSGWLKALLENTGFDLETARTSGNTVESHHQVTLSCGQPIGIWIDIPNDLGSLQSPHSPKSEQVVENNPRPLYHHINEPTSEPVEFEEFDTPIWRATDQDNQVVGLAIGKMVHKAIQRWRFPGDPGLMSLLDSVAQESGVVEDTHRQLVLQEAELFLTRFRAHPLWQSIDQSVVKLHEVPYTMLRDDRTELGYIDLLYKETESTAGWSIVDFKTDTIQTDAELVLLVDQYSQQAHRYTRAVRSLLGLVDTVYLCFLDAIGQVAVIEV